MAYCNEIRENEKDDLGPQEADTPKVPKDLQEIFTSYSYKATRLQGQGPTGQLNHKVWDCHIPTGGKEAAERRHFHIGVAPGKN